MMPAGQPFTPQQLEVRRPLWDTLGDLYLDTDTRPDLPRMARVLAESGLGEAELNSIWEDEVTPALAFNLSVVAGEWAFFDLDWLQRRIVRRQRYMQQAHSQRPLRWPLLTRWLGRIWPNGTQPHFQTVMALRGELLTLPEAQRQARAVAWSWTAHVYFWPDSPWRPERPPDTDLPADFAFLKPHLCPLLTASDHRKMPLEPRRAHVLKLIRGDG